MSNTIASNNGSFGVWVQPSELAVVTGVLSKVTANTNGLTGIAEVGTFLTGILEVTIVDSEASNNVGFGVRVAGTPAARVMVRNVVASYNKVGLEAGETATLWVAHSAATGNVTGLSNPSGTLFTFGNNDIAGNGENSTGPLIRVPPL